eukprot:scaffold2671_cov252-Pinguiococcus_pyrenoidosus.AAC.16
MDLLLLPISIRAEDRLRVGGWIPSGIVEDDASRSRQIYSHPASPEAKQHHFPIFASDPGPTVVELLNDLESGIHGRGAVKPKEVMIEAHSEVLMQRVL